MRLALVHLEISTRAGCQAHLALVHLGGHLLQRLRRFGFMFSLLDGAVYEDIEGFRYVFDRAMYLSHQTSSVLSKAPQAHGLSSSPLASALHARLLSARELRAASLEARSSIRQGPCVPALAADEADRWPATL